jgi:luciferase family oxidoreductase group 1
MTVHGLGNSERMFPTSILDLTPITVGGSAGEALRHSLDLAQHAESWGYRRFWLAEHHNMPGVASAATAVALGFVANGTSSIRVGAGGIMLPNHAPLVIAEQFGTLAALYPGRIDLGVGRAPGTDPVTTRALRRQHTDVDAFPENVVELLGYFKPETQGQVIRAVPGVGTQVPVWILGSSLFGAQLAAKFGLPFAFAAHFAPDQLLHALELYRARFEPSETLAAPHSMACTNVFVADTDAEAARLFTSLEQAFLALRSGRPGRLPPPLESADHHALGGSLTQTLDLFRYAVVGSPETVRVGLQKFIQRTGVDELMTTAMIFSHQARLRSFELLAQVMKEMG